MINFYGKLYGKEKDIKFETTEEFLARGGKIQRISTGRSTRNNKKSKNIDAQALLNSVVGTKDEVKVIEFLKSQGIEVTDV
jgi:hypothetical protein